VQTNYSELVVLRDDNDDVGRASRPSPAALGTQYWLLLLLMLLLMLMMTMMIDLMQNDEGSRQRR